jgi:hypothetical protein
MTHIYPFDALCPKCGRAGVAKRYEPEITEEDFNKQAHFNEKLPADLVTIPKAPQEEHLVRDCECGHVFWTRTRDYEQTAEATLGIVEPSGRQTAVHFSDIDRLARRERCTAIYLKNGTFLLAVEPDITTIRNYCEAAGLANVPGDRFG